MNSLDAETFAELSESLNNLTHAHKKGTAASNLGNLLGAQNAALMGVATQAVDKLASQATSRALFMVARFNPMWGRFVCVRACVHLCVARARVHASTLLWLLVVDWMVRKVAPQ